jgi:hypothetical protein
MKIPHEIKLFSVVLLSTLLIFSSSHFGVKAFEGIISKAKGFPENTWIGPLDVSGLEKVEAKEQLDTKVTEWKTHSSVELLYREVNVPLPLEGIFIDVEQSVEGAQGSVKNDLLINMDNTTLQSVLAILSSTFSKDTIEIDRLQIEILKEVKSLESGIIQLDVGDFLLVPEKNEQVVNSITIPIMNEDLKNIGSSIMIPQQSTFSLLSFLEEQGLLTLDPMVIDILSSGIYQTILHSNFEILERHISTKLPEHISMGFEAKVDAKLKWDLSFYNPNMDNYKLEIYSNGQSLTFDLIGIPFAYEYVVMQEGLKIFDPKTIKQYSPLIEPGQFKVTQEGQKGFYLEHSRLVMDEKGKIVEQQLISKDYYAPIHLVKVFGLGSNDSVLPSEDEIATPVEVPNEKDPLEDDIIVPDSPIDGELEDPIWGRPDEIGK